MRAGFLASVLAVLEAGGVVMPLDLRRGIPALEREAARRARARGHRRRRGGRSARRGRGRRQPARAAGRGVPASSTRRGRRAVHGRAGLGLAVDAIARQVGLDARLAAGARRAAGARVGADDGAGDVARGRLARCVGGRRQSSSAWRGEARRQRRLGRRSALTSCRWRRRRRSRAWCSSAAATLAALRRGVSRRRGSRARSTPPRRCASPPPRATTPWTRAARRQWLRRRRRARGALADGDARLPRRCRATGAAFVERDGGRWLRAWPVDRVDAAALERALAATPACARRPCSPCATPPASGSTRSSPATPSRVPRHPARVVVLDSLPHTRRRCRRSRRAAAEWSASTERALAHFRGTPRHGAGLRAALRSRVVDLHLPRRRRRRQGRGAHRSGRRAGRARSRPRRRARAARSCTPSRRTCTPTTSPAARRSPSAPARGRSCTATARSPARRCASARAIACASARSSSPCSRRPATRPSRSASSSATGASPATRCSSAPAAAPTFRAAIRARCTTASTRACSRCPTTPSSIPRTTTTGAPRRPSASEKRGNTRLAGKSRDEFIALMNHLGLPPPKKLDVALPANLALRTPASGVARRGDTVRGLPCPATCRSATSGCWSSSTTTTSCAISTTRTSARRTTPAAIPSASACSSTGASRWMRRDNGWQIERRYERDTLVTEVVCTHDELGARRCTAPTASTFTRRCWCARCA